MNDSAAVLASASSSTPMEARADRILWMREHRALINAETPRTTINKLKKKTTTAGEAEEVVQVSNFDFVCTYHVNSPN